MFVMTLRLRTNFKKLTLKRSKCQSGTFKDATFSYTYIDTVQLRIIKVITQNCQPDIVSYKLGCNTEKKKTHIDIIHILSGSNTD